MVKYLSALCSMQFNSISMYLVYLAFKVPAKYNLFCPFNINLQNIKFALLL